MKTMLAILTVAGAGLAISGHASAQGVTCKRDGTQIEMNACAAQDFKRDDADLNKVYTAYTQKLDAAHRANLKAVQLNWIKFRDSACDFETLDYKGGSIYPLALNNCLATYTRQRRVQLEILYQDLISK